MKRLWKSLLRHTSHADTNLFSSCDICLQEAATIKAFFDPLGIASEDIGGGSILVNLDAHDLYAS